MENIFDNLIIRDIASSLKTIASGGGSHTDLSSIAAKLDDIVAKLAVVAANQEAIAGKLDPLYMAEYVETEPET